MYLTGFWGFGEQYVTERRSKTFCKKLKLIDIEEGKETTVGTN
jgi:hypothetical protein